MRVASSPANGKDLTANTFTHREYMMTERHFLLYGSREKLLVFLTTDLNELYCTNSSLCENSGYCLQWKIFQMKDLLGSNNIDVIRWIAGKHNIADTSTKKKLFNVRTTHSYDGGWITSVSGAGDSKKSKLHFFNFLENFHRIIFTYYRLADIWFTF